MKVRNTSPSQATLIVFGVGEIAFGDVVEVDEALGERLCEGPNFEPVEEAPAPTAENSSSSDD